MDIQKCEGNTCPVKDLCYRYTSKASEDQFYFTKEPYKIKDNKFKCEFLWTNDNHSVLDQLNSTLKKEGDK